MTDELNIPFSIVLDGVGKDSRLRIVVERLDGQFPLALDPDTKPMAVVQEMVLRFMAILVKANEGNAAFAAACDEAGLKFTVEKD